MDNKDKVSLLIAGGIVLLLIYGFITIRYKKLSPSWKNQTFIFSIFLGAIPTYYLNNHLGLGAVMSAAGVGLIASYIPNKFLKKIKMDSASIYCGTFIGMTSSNVADGILFIVLASFISIIIYYLLQKHFNGFGGKLGSIAFGGTSGAYFIIYILNNIPWN